MAAVCRRAVEEGIAAVAFGDLFLQDIREYREKQLLDTGLQPVFPVWKIPTADLAAEMIRAGLRARLTCVDPRVLPRDFAGRDFDGDLLDALPAGIDPCGENGEFHTFVYDGPMLEHRIDVTPGEVVERDGFVFADLTEAL
jgi:diphthamide synthase (EF-2-diphthine--ammonia ligase)